MNHYSGLKHTLRDSQAHDNFHDELKPSIFSPLVIICCSCNGLRLVVFKELNIGVIFHIRPDETPKLAFWYGTSEN